jgi:hypothetical protein
MADDPALPKGQDRGLTPGEITLAKSVFGDSIDYSEVRIHRSKIPGVKSMFQPDNVPVPASGRDIYAPDGAYADDFSTKNKSDFIHLMAYVWQFQDNITTPKAAEKWAWDNRNNIDAATKTVIDPQKDLKDYNIEQRAQLVTDLYQYREEQAHPVTPPTAAERAQTLQKVGDMLKAQPTEQSKKIALAWFGIELGPDGQPRYNAARVQEAQANSQKYAAEKKQEDSNLLQVMSHFVANPAYLDPTKTAAPKPPPAPPPPASTTPAAKPKTPGA